MISLRVWTDCSDCSRREAFNLDITKLPQRNRFRRDLKASDGNADNENSIEHDDMHSNLDNDYLDMNEERIEGLEQVVESFQKTLKHMKREMRLLKETNDELSRRLNMTHRQPSEDIDEAGDKNYLKPSKHHYQCVDRKGINRLNNEIWMEDDCTNCLCQHHQITCTTEKCPDDAADKKCEPGYEWGKKSAVCCPMCVEQKLSVLNDEATITSNVTSSR